MKKKYIKNLVVKGALPVAFTLVLTSCDALLSETKEEAPKVSKVIEAMEENKGVAEVEKIIEVARVGEIGKEIDDNYHTEQEVFIEEDDDIVLSDIYDAIDENGIFFEKVNADETVTWDDIILVNEERRIEETETSNSLENMLSNSASELQLNLRDWALIDQLNIEQLAKTVFLSSAVTDKVEKHSYSSLYIEENDDLDWNLLFTVLKDNLEDQKQQIKLKVKKSIGKNKEYYQRMAQDLEQLELFSDEDLKSWIEQLHQFVLSSRKLVKNIDMRRLACTLENYVVAYEQSDDLNSGIFVKTSGKQTVYPKWNNYYPDLEKFTSINYHQFYNLLSAACPDEENELGQLCGAGFALNKSLRSDLEFTKSHGLGFDSDNIYLPFNYSYLEQGNAESYSSSLLGTNSQSYFYKQFVADNLEFSLFLQPEYEVGNLSKANLLHNPIALVQQFPILQGENDQTGEEWFYSQLKMLECYNVVNDPHNSLMYFWNLYFVASSELLHNHISVLESYGDLQLTRNFIWTLLHAKDIEKKDMSLGDCYYLMHLLEARIEAQRKMVCLNHGMDHIEDDSLHTNWEQLMDIFKQSLKERYASSDFKKFGNYENYSLANGRLSNAFSESEKRYFYQLYLGIDDYYKWAAEEKDKTFDDLLEEYYLVR